MYGQKKKKSLAVIGKQVAHLRDVMPRLPNEDESFRAVSLGGFSSIAFIVQVAMEKGIKKLHATTLRVGKRELEALMTLSKAGKLDSAHFCVGGIMATDKGTAHDYFSAMVAACEEMGWSFTVLKNHSKLILMETFGGEKFVLETSSNLNENPKIEQFCFEQDSELYNFYLNVITEVSGDGERKIPQVD